ncbi:hypothetical protein AB0L65_33365 [Nonomuraea sp. NPDC052116]|uniref:hypothetical protein n=1 Tax=Nonomuraea sp. NPDC052116 TaxID=3155665 RepID=UPI00342E6F6D
MEQPTDGDQPAQPRELLHYDTWADEEGYHARLFQELPRDALDYGCVQEIWATTETELIQEAARNRVKVWTWESSGLGELPFRTGDLS